MIAHRSSSSPAPPAGHLQSFLQQQSQTSLKPGFETPFSHLLLRNFQQNWEQGEEHLDHRQDDVDISASVLTCPDPGRAQLVGRI